MPTILLHVNDDASMARRLQAAIDLARGLGSARLTCVQATPIEALIGGDPFIGVCLSSQLTEELRRRERDLRVTVERSLRETEIQWSWIDSHQDPVLAIVERAGLADFVVLGLGDDQSSPQARALVGDVAVTTRAPVLAVPQAHRFFSCDGTAVVAWNGSLESAHALRAALPLLAKASAIKIVTVGEDDLLVPATAAYEFLADHKITAEICPWKREFTRLSDDLIDAVRTFDAQYLVAGAYGHSRFRETVLGGVTRELIHGASVPLILSH
jgi:nucleotide-binding universal stress UspA family protein